jgi:folate-dependent phosphoribosylglycinamide formyltransferase PurN
MNLKKNVLFVGRDNAFNRNIIKRLSLEHIVVGAMFVEIDRFTLKGRLNRIKRRKKKYGLVKVLDELLFHIFDRIILRKVENKFINSNENIKSFLLDTPDLSIPIFNILNINDKSSIEIINNLQPDFIFSVCSSAIFGKDVFSIPKYGTLVLHEGLTPEYKGLHTPLWAFLNKEYQYIGYTLIKVNERIDGGEIVSQNSYQLEIDEGLHCWSYVAHKAIIINLELMINDLSNYLNQYPNYKFVNQGDRKNGYFTWVGISDYIKKMK